MLIIGGSGLEKTTPSLNLINNQPGTDKIYLHAKNPYEEKYQYLINKREKVGLDHFNDPKAFTKYSNHIQDVYKNIEEYNPGKKHKVLLVFNNMIADMINNKNLNPVVTTLFISDGKLNIYLAFITKSYFKVPKYVRLNSTYFSLCKFQIKENFIKLPQVIHQMLVLKILWRFMKIHCRTMLPSNPNNNNNNNKIKQTKFTCSPLGKAFEKQTKSIED